MIVLQKYCSRYYFSSHKTNSRLLDRLLYNRESRMSLKYGHASKMVRYFFNNNFKQNKLKTCVTELTFNFSKSLGSRIPQDNLGTSFRAMPSWYDTRSFRGPIDTGRQLLFVHHILWYVDDVTID